MYKKTGFTLIELLIVVAIIGILAAIAIPNFLNAQVRAKIARAKSDMRTLSTGLEQYYVDYNHYCLANWWQMSTKTLDVQQFGADLGLITLSTPISYIAQGLIEDVFPCKGRITSSGGPYPPNIGHIHYGYTGRYSGGTSGLVSEAGAGNPAVKVDWYVLQSSGPDQYRFTLGSGIIDDPKRSVPVSMIPLTVL